MMIAVKGTEMTDYAVFAQKALYDEVRPTRRARLHRRVAEAISAVYPVDPDPHVGELAYHYAHSVGSGDSVKAIECLRNSMRSSGVASSGSSSRPSGGGATSGSSGDRGDAALTST